MIQTGDFDSYNSADDALSSADMGRRRGQRNGYLYEKSGSWILQWREDSKDITGRPVRDKRSRVIARSHGPGKIGRREAERLAYELVLCKLDTVSLAPASMITFGDFVRQRFEPDHMWTLKPSGREHYTRMLASHILPKLGSIRLRDINQNTLSDFFRAKQAEGYTRALVIGKEKIDKRENYASQTLAHMRNVISAVLRHARNCQMFTGQLPTEGLRLPRIENKERGALTTEQASMFISALPGQYAVLAALLLTTGLRIGEACGLRWKRIDFAGGLVQVRENFVTGEWTTPKTRLSVRDVPVPAAVLAALASLRRRDAATGPDDTVFVRVSGKPLGARNAASGILKPAAKRLGMPWVSWHSFRHSNATLADQAGMTVAERRKGLGHGSDSMALRYSHTDIELMRVKVEMISARVMPKQIGEIQ